MIIQVPDEMTPDILSRLRAAGLRLRYISDRSVVASPRDDLPASVVRLRPAPAPVDGGAA